MTNSTATAKAIKTVKSVKAIKTKKVNPMTKGDKNVKALEAQISDTIQHWTKARDGVQSVLVGLVSHVHMVKNQDQVARLVNMLLDGLGDGINGNAIREWAGLHLNMVLNKENKMASKKFDIKAMASTAAASKCLWYTLKIQKPVMFDLDQKIVALMNAAIKKSEDADGACIVVQSEALKALEVLATASMARIEAAKKAEELAAKKEA